MIVPALAISDGFSLQRVVCLLLLLLLLLIRGSRRVRGSRRIRDRRRIRGGRRERSGGRESCLEFGELIAECAILRPQLI